METVKTSIDPAEARLENEVFEFFVRAAQLLGQPRSIGEIYGLLYLSLEPLSMDQIVQKLGLSTGSVSQGLKQLRAFRAIRTTYVPGQRRDFYLVEQDLRHLVSGFVREEIRPHLDSGRERIERMFDALSETRSEAKEELSHRIEKIRKLHGLAEKLLPMILRFLKL